MSNNYAIQIQIEGDVYVCVINQTSVFLIFWRFPSANLYFEKSLNNKGILRHGLHRWCLRLHHNALCIALLKCPKIVPKCGERNMLKWLRTEGQLTNQFRLKNKLSEKTSPSSVICKTKNITGHGGCSNINWAFVKNIFKNIFHWNLYGNL